MKHVIFTALLFTVVLTTTCKKEESLVNDTDQRFLKLVSSSNNNQIEAATIARSRTKDASVKNYATLMVSDYSIAQKELTGLAGAQAVSISSQADEDHAGANFQLMQMSGKTFDVTYMQSQSHDHKVSIDLYNDEINNGKNKAVINYAERYLQKITIHSNMADTISSRVNN